MNQSLLITGGNLETRAQKARELACRFLEIKNNEETLKSHPDYLEIIQELATGIGIGQIRQLTKDLLLKPVAANCRLAIIDQAETLTVEAQNAFLKTLEEPPEKAVIILSAPNPHLLLPTIVSRCRLEIVPDTGINLSTEEKNSLTLALNDILNIEIPKKFFWAEKLGKSREEALKNLDKMVCLGEAIMIKQIINAGKTDPETLKIAGFLQNSIPAKNWLLSNVNPRFALENLFLSC